MVFTRINPHEESQTHDIISNPKYAQFIVKRKSTPVCFPRAVVAFSNKHRCNVEEVNAQTTDQENRFLQRHVYGSFEVFLFEQKKNINILSPPRISILH